MRGSGGVTTANKYLLNHFSWVKLFENQVKIKFKKSGLTLHERLA